MKLIITIQARREAAGPGITVQAEVKTIILQAEVQAEERGPMNAMEVPTGKCQIITEFTVTPKKQRREEVIHVAGQNREATAKIILRSQKKATGMLTIQRKGKSITAMDGLQKDMMKGPIENILVIDIENHPKIGIVKETEMMNTKEIDQERDISIITVRKLTGEGMRNHITRRLTRVVRVHNIDPGVSKKDVMIQKRMYLTMKEVDTLVDVKMTDMVQVTESMFQVSIGTHNMNNQSELRGHHLVI